MTSNFKMGLRHLPFAFTEQGVAMLSSVLNGGRAIQVHTKTKKEIGFTVKEQMKKYWSHK